MLFLVILGSCTKGNEWAPGEGPRALFLELQRPIFRGLKARARGASIPLEVVPLMRQKSFQRAAGDSEVEIHREELFRVGTTVAWGHQGALWEASFQGGSMSLEATVENPKGLGPVEGIVVNLYVQGELVQTYTIEKRLKGGESHVLEVPLEGLPPGPDGEGVALGIADFYMVNMGTTYQKFLDDYPLELIPLAYNTPLESKVFYVGEHDRQEAIEKLMGGVANNLPDFMSKGEIRHEAQRGRWFVFSTDRMISVSYLTGALLAKQKAPRVLSHYERAKTGASFEIYPLGEATGLSTVYLHLKPLKAYGQKKEEKTFYGKNPTGPCEGNCFDRPPYFCEYVLTLSRAFEHPLTFSQDFTGALGRVDLLVGQEEFSLKDLLVSQRAQFQWEGAGISLKIEDVLSLSESSKDKATVAVRFRAKREVAPHGIRIVQYRPKDAFPTCAQSLLRGIFQKDWPLSVRSPKNHLLLEKSGVTQRGLKTLEQALRRGEDRTYIEEFSVELTGAVEGGIP